MHDWLLHHHASVTLLSYLAYLPLLLLVNGSGCRFLTFLWVVGRTREAGRLVSFLLLTPSLSWWHGVLMILRWVGGPLVEVPLWLLSWVLLLQSSALERRTLNLVTLMLVFGFRLQL